MNDIDKLKLEIFDLIELQAGLAARHQQVTEAIRTKHAAMDKLRADQKSADEAKAAA